MKTSPEMKFILMGLVADQLFQRKKKKKRNLKTQQKKLSKMKNREKNKFSNEKISMSSL